MRRGDIEEARKYLNLLDATLFYHSWARSKEEQLKGEETLSMEKRLPRKSDWEREHDILMSISDYPGVLSSLVAEYPENKQALDYLLCYYLLNENLNSFKNAFDTYYKGKFEVVPRLYEEALVQVLSKSSDEEVAGYSLNNSVSDQRFARKAKAFSMSSGVSIPIVSCSVMPTLILYPFSNQRNCSRLSASSKAD